MPKRVFWAQFAPVTFPGAPCPNCRTCCLAANSRSCCWSWQRASRPSTHWRRLCSGWELRSRNARSGGCVRFGFVLSPVFITVVPHQDVNDAFISAFEAYAAPMTTAESMMDDALALPAALLLELELFLRLVWVQISCRQRKVCSLAFERRFCR